MAFGARILYLIFAIFAQLYLIQTYTIHLDMTTDELQTTFSVDSHEEVPDYEIVYLRISGEDKDQKHPDTKRDGASIFHSKSSLTYSFEAFGKKIQLNLKKNDNLLSTNASLIKTTSNGHIEIENSYEEICSHYISTCETIAAISHCYQSHQTDNGLRGIILTDEHPIQISPVPIRLRTNGTSKHVAHILKVPKFDGNVSYGEDGQEAISVDSELGGGVAFIGQESNDPSDIDMLKRNVAKLTIELAVYLETSAYKMYLKYLGSENAVIQFILGYINQVQALYLLSSLQKPVYISIVHLEMQKEVPRNSNLHLTDANKLLSAFGKYEQKIACDMSLFLSGKDFFMINPKTKAKSSTVMGLASVNGVCRPGYRGVISEIGVTNSKGKLYPSAGWTSAFVTVHEIGHNLGMSHDSLGNKCAENGYIMSPSRGTSGETTWSTCSAAVIKKKYQDTKSCLANAPKRTKLDHMKYKGEPGQYWDGHAQCQTLLKTHEAWMDEKQPIKEICTKLKCRSTGKHGYYTSGPAIHGTFCGSNNWCQNGKCAPSTRKINPVVPKWGPWKSEPCKAGCLQKSKGAIRQTRLCNNPKPMNVEKWCQGSTRRVKFCDDSKLCKNRQSTKLYAEKMCKKFMPYVKDLTKEGTQLPYSKTRKSYFACAIACKLGNTRAWYTPMVELNDVPNMSTFFPDGSWCHNDGSQNYYCQNNDCLPESSRAGKSLDVAKDGLAGVSNNEDVSKHQDDIIKKYLQFTPDTLDPIVKETPVLSKHEGNGQPVNDMVIIPE